MCGIGLLQSTEVRNDVMKRTQASQWNYLRLVAGPQKNDDVKKPRESMAVDSQVILIDLGGNNVMGIYFIPAFLEKSLSL